MWDEKRDKAPADCQRDPDPSGAGSAVATYFLIGAGDVTVAGLDPEKALGILVLTYGGQAFQVLAGLLGLLLSKKKSLLTVILGVLLFVPQLIAFLHVKNDIALILVNAVLLAVPYYYLHNAYKNFKE